jgi:hypothetical protein
MDKRSSLLEALLGSKYGAVACIVYAFKPLAHVHAVGNNALNRHRRQRPMVHCRQLHVGRHYVHTQCFSALWRLLLLIALAYPDLYEHKPTSALRSRLRCHSQSAQNWRSEMHQASEQASCSRSTVLAPVRADALDPNDRACYICFQPFGSTGSLYGESEVPVQLPCGHVFGEVCISIWTHSSNSCPLCRKKVLGIDDCPANTRSSESGSSNTHNSRLTASVDIWLDDEVWNTSSQNHEPAVSYAEVETLVEYYTRDLSNVNLQPHRVPETLFCGEYRGLCHCCDDRGTRNAALPRRRLTPPAAAQPIDNFDLVQLGSQFARLDYR